MDLESPAEFYSFVSEEVNPALFLLVHLKEKDALRNYSKVLQHGYATNSPFSELQVKRFIKAVGPQLLLKKETTTASIGEENHLPLSDDDYHIIQYLCGAILKWAIKKFLGMEQEWCQSQISDLDFTHSHFRNINRSLICPNEKFTKLMTKCEMEYRKQKSTRKINVNGILGTLKWQEIYPEIQDMKKHVLFQLLARYVRMRGHIACTYAKRQHIVKRKVTKPSNATRQMLKNTQQKV